MQLPDLFRFNGGSKVESAEDWQLRRREISESLVGIAYGGMPSVPERGRFEKLGEAFVRQWEGVRTLSGRVHCGRGFSFLLKLYVPPGPGPFSVVLYGDACWHYANDEVLNEVLQRGHIFAQFNRLELAPDLEAGGRSAGIYPLFPGENFGALSAWAWGYHRCLDVLQDMEMVRREQIAITGHSRGGKTVLLAAATDERVALVAANNSGAAGAGCYRFQGPGSETLADCIQRFPYWYGAKLGDYADREHELPFDQHFFKALVAPRAFLTTEALDDLWANPQGTLLTHKAAAEVYRFLGAPEQIGIVYRPGGHNHALADWKVLLDFMDWRFSGKQAGRGFQDDPFPEISPSS